MKTANDYKGLTDSDILEAAVNAREAGIVIIPPRKQETEPERDYWLIDRAILLPENTTIILQNATIQLSDRCRDNFFRSANCGLGIAEIEPISNIHIQGIGKCVLRGADHPRATGDSSKMQHCPCPKEEEQLLIYGDWIPEERRAPGKIDFWDIHDHSYGTDAGKEGESQYGDWRGIGILFAEVTDFSIENIKIVDSHGWGISLETCSHGRVERIEFDMPMEKTIDGMRHNMENQDGVDIRNGCHDILINDITGGTGDDIIALTAIANVDKEFRASGSLCSTHVMHNDWSKRDPDIHDVIIRNVKGYSKGGICYHIRLLPAGVARIYNVVIDGVVDTSPDDVMAGGVLLLGGAFYGENREDGMCNLSISNVICNSRDAVLVESWLCDSVITNVINKNPDCPVLNVNTKDCLRNVQMSNLISAGETLVAYRNE